MGTVLKMSSKSGHRDKTEVANDKETAKVVVHPSAGLRDVERAMRYIKARDDARGRK